MAVRDQDGQAGLGRPGPTVKNAAVHRNSRWTARISSPASVLPSLIVWLRRRRGDCSCLPGDTVTMPSLGLDRVDGEPVKVAWCRQNGPGLR